MSLWVNSRLASWRMSTAALLAVVAFVALSAACTGSDPTPTAQATTAPTVAATSTSVPAATPTAQATVAPTPTVQATTQPTPAPASTRVPAATPTAQPSPVPTRAPAPTPTRVPTATPTVQTVDDLSVVTSTSILADWVRAVGGDRVTVKSLVPRQSDPHNFQPGARDIADVADADVVFVVGLGLEESWLDDLIRNAAKSPETIVELADGVNPIPFTEFGGGHDDHDDEHGDEDDEGHDHDEDGDEHHEDEDGDEHDEDEDHEGEVHDDDGDEHHEDEDGHAHDEDEDGDHEGHEDEDEHGHDEDEDAHGDDDHGHDHGANDPHFWFDPERVKIAVETIEHALSARAPGLHDEFHDRADAYMEQLDALDAWTVNRVASIPQAARYLVTTHDSFGYFATRYGFEIVGAVIPGGGTEVEPSPAELAALAELIQEHGVAVVFSEEQLSDALTKTLASEAGASVVGGLYTGSLGAEGSPAGTYIDMVRNNVDVIANALTPR